MTTRDAISNALDGDKLIEEDDLEQRVERIPTKILDESINISRVKKYFTNSAWKRLQCLLTQVEQENTWDCKTCGKELNKRDLAIGCDVCLEWYHATCLGKSEPPKAKNWVCRNCIKIS